MPRSDRSRPTSGRTARTRSRSGGSSSSSSGLVIGGISAAVLIVVAVAFFANGAGTKKASATETKPAPAPKPETHAVENTPPVESTSYAPRPGKSPARPAPAIADADLATAEAHYRQAVQHWNDGQRARTAGNTDAYLKAMDDAYAEMEEQRAALRTYTDWYEEADLEGWEMPGSYVGLSHRLDTYDRMFQKVKKLKQVTQPR